MKDGSAHQENEEVVGIGDNSGYWWKKTEIVHRDLKPAKGKHMAVELFD